MKLFSPKEATAFCKDLASGKAVLIVVEQRDGFWAYSLEIWRFGGVEV